MSSAQLSERVLRAIILRNGTPCGPIQIIVLATLQRPEKADKPGEPKEQSKRNKIDQDFHGNSFPAGDRARSEFNITRSDEPDIAAAAINGVVKPATAIGTARKL